MVQGWKKISFQLSLSYIFLYYIHVSILTARFDITSSQYLLSMTVETLISDFDRDCKARRYAIRTIESYVSHIRCFLSLSEVDADYEDLKSFLIHIRDEKGYTLATCNNYFASLSTFYDFLEFEKIVERNLVPAFRKRYLRSYKKQYTPESRQLIDIEAMKQLVNAPEYLVYRTFILFLAKTGVRRNELITLDRADLDLNNLTVHLKHTAKRSNRTVFFDKETKAFLEAYLAERTDSSPALFVGRQGSHRITRNQVYDVVSGYAEKLGLHDPRRPSGRKIRSPLLQALVYYLASKVRYAKSFHSGTPRRFKRRSNRCL
jgi:integrase/recombinase XerD